jgi:hypothetical protein
MLFTIEWMFDDGKFDTPWIVVSIQLVPGGAARPGPVA